MATKKQQKWGSAQEATAILSAKAGRDIDPSYVRSLVRAGKVAAQQRDGRTNEYDLDACRAYEVRPRTGQRVEEPVRDRRSGRPPGRPRKHAVSRGEQE